MITDSAAFKKGWAERSCKLDNGEIPTKDERNIRSIQFMGYMIFYGRNAFSNDVLIREHKESHGRCLWLHASCAKGCHVVLCTDGKELPDESVKKRAAQVALRYSDYNMSLVKIAELKDVYKPENAKPGVWSTWRTTTITL